MLSTATDDRLAAVRAALLGANPIPSPVSGRVGIEELCKTYNVHRATVARKLAGAGVRPARVIGGRNYYECSAAIAAMERQGG